MQLDVGLRCRSLLPNTKRGHNCDRRKGGATVTEIRRLNWGCGDVAPPGWINSDIKGER